MQLRRACRLEIINQESRSIRINPVLRLALSVFISDGLFCALAITCNPALSALGEAENSVAESSTSQKPNKKLAINSLWICFN
jgi:hypothetical protein